MYPPAPLNKHWSQLSRNPRLELCSGFLSVSELCEVTDVMSLLREESFVCRELFLGAADEGVVGDFI